MEEALYAPQVNKSAEAGQGPDLALDFFPFNQPAEDPSLFFLPLVLEEELSGDDGIFGLAVELDDLELEGLTEELVRFLDYLDVRMGVGQKGVEAHIDGVAVIDFSADLSGHEALGVEGFLQVVEGPQRVGPLLGQDEVSLLDLAGRDLLGAELVLVQKMFVVFGGDLFLPVRLFL